MRWRAHLNTVVSLALWHSPAELAAARRAGGDRRARQGGAVRSRQSARRHAAGGQGASVQRALMAQQCVHERGHRLCQQGAHGPARLRLSFRCDVNARTTHASPKSVPGTLCFAKQDRIVPLDHRDRQPSGANPGVGAALCTVLASQTRTSLRPLPASLTGACAAAVTLCALHFLSCGLGLSCMKALNIMSASRKQIPWKGARSLPRYPRARSPYRAASRAVR